MTTKYPERMCPTCKARHAIPPRPVNPNYAQLPITRSQWFQLRAAAEAFDRAASSRDEDEGDSGAGDGETLYPARTFIDWIKTDCTGFKEKHDYEADGAPQRNVDGSTASGNRGEHRHPDPLPFAGKLGGGEAA